MGFALWLICPTGGRVLAQNYWWEAGISESVLSALAAGFVGTG